jgi:hypothetical protein
VIYLPGDPRTTMYVKQLNLIAGLVERETVMYITTDHWRKIQAELDAQYLDALMDPTGPIPWRVSDTFKVGPLTVVNAGTDDQRVVNRKNADTPGAIDFIAKRDALRVA